MTGLNIRKQITLFRTADDWELYTASKNCDAAATAINAVIVRAFNKGASEDEVRAAAHKAMRQYADFGAADSEPRYHLECILAKLFDHGVEF